MHGAETRDVPRNSAPGPRQDMRHAVSAVLRHLCKQEPWTLGEFLRKNVDFGPGAGLEQDGDPSPYTEMLENTIVCPIKGMVMSPEDKVVEVTQEYLTEFFPREITNKVVSNSERFRREYGYRGQDSILARGYRQINNNHPHHNNQGFFPEHINFMEGLLKSKPWRTLFERIGERVFRFLLLKTVTFARMDNDCLVQISGPVILNMITPWNRTIRMWMGKRPIMLETGDDEDCREPARKRARVEVSTSASTLKRKHGGDEPAVEKKRRRPGKRERSKKELSVPAKATKDRAPLADGVPESVNRLRMMYSNSFVRRPGLPQRHILNLRSVRSCRHLYHEIFTSPPDLQQIHKTKRPDTRNPGGHLKAPTPKGLALGKLRIRSKQRSAVLPVLRQMRRRHRRCNYLKILNETAPIPKWIFRRRQRAETHLLGEDLQTQEMDDSDGYLTQDGMDDPIDPVEPLTQPSAERPPSSTYTPVSQVKAASKVHTPSDQTPILAPATASDEYSRTNNTWSERGNPKGVSRLVNEDAELWETQHFKNSNQMSIETEYDAKREKFKKLHGEVTPPGDVAKFLKRVCVSVLPRGLFGGEHNRRVIFKGIDKLVSFGRFERLSLDELCVGFRISKGLCFATNSDGGRSPTDHERDVQRARSWIRWLFNCFLVPMITTHFYCTDFEGEKGRMLFYRKPIWVLNRTFSSRQFHGTHFRKVALSEAPSIGKKRRLGFSKVRFVPKGTSSRPIVNLRSQMKMLDDKGNVCTQPKSINELMSPVFYTLRYLRGLDPSIVGMTVAGYKDIYRRVRGFKDALISKHGSASKIPRLYCVSIDISKAFDTVRHDKLLNIVENIVSKSEFAEEEYSLFKYYRASCPCDRMGQSGMAKVSVRSKTVVTGPMENFNLLNHTRNTLSKREGGSLYVDRVLVSRLTREELTRWLREHITENTIRLGKDYFIQHTGIPQGSILSTLLCNFYYGDMERSHLASLPGCSVAPDAGGLGMRFTDDSLYIATSRADVDAFLSKFKNEAILSEYNCNINQDKLRRNYSSGDGPSKGEIAQGELLPWCGLLINLTTLEFHVDYSRYSRGNIRASMAVERCVLPGINLLVKMKNAIKQKCHAILLDGHINSNRTVVFNIFQMFLLVGVKLHYMVDRLGGHARLRPSQQPGFFSSVILQAIGYMQALIRSLQKGEIAANQRCNVPVSMDQVAYLGVRAFCVVLKAAGKEYRSVVAMLKKDETRLRKHCQGVIMGVVCDPKCIEIFLGLLEQPRHERAKTDPRALSNSESEAFP